MDGAVVRPVPCIVKKTAMKKAKNDLVQVIKIEEYLTGMCKYDTRLLIALLIKAIQRGSRKMHDLSKKIVLSCHNPNDAAREIQRQGFGATLLSAAVPGLKASTKMLVELQEYRTTWLKKEIYLQKLTASMSVKGRGLDLESETGIALERANTVLHDLKSYSVQIMNHRGNLMREYQAKIQATQDAIKAMGEVEISNRVAACQHLFDTLEKYSRYYVTDKDNDLTQ